MAAERTNGPGPLSCSVSRTMPRNSPRTTTGASAMVPVALRVGCSRSVNHSTLPGPCRSAIDWISACAPSRWLKSASTPTRASSGMPMSSAWPMLWLSESAMSWARTRSLSCRMPRSCSCVFQARTAAASSSRASAIHPSRNAALGRRGRRGALIPGARFRPAARGSRPCAAAPRRTAPAPGPCGPCAHGRGAGTAGPGPSARRPSPPARPAPG